MSDSSSTAFLKTNTADVRPMVEYYVHNTADVRPMVEYYVHNTADVITMLNTMYIIYKI